jgi:hypothetical protein
LQTVQMQVHLANSVMGGEAGGGAWTGDWQRIVQVNYRSVLSSERAPHNMTANVSASEHSSICHCIGFYKIWWMYW